MARHDDWFEKESVMIRNLPKFSPQSLKKSLLFASLPMLLVVGQPSLAQKSDGKQEEQTAQIIDEGLNRSEVMISAHELLDGIGARLSNSPQMRQAEAWAVQKFNGWGLKNVRKEGFEFGRGWSITSSSVKMVSPRPITLTAIPVAWTPSTNGVITSDIIVAPISKKAHFDEWRGKLAGKIVMISLPGTGNEPTRPAFRRLQGDDFSRLDEFRQPTHDPKANDRRLKRAEFAEALDAFLTSEGAVAWARRARRDGKLLHGEGYTHRVGRTPNLPGVEISAEDYRRLARLAKTGPAPTISINSNVQFHDEDTKAYNIIAEIPGSDPKAGYVMAGGHFDSWAGGDGAVDNASGSVTVMEAARILSKMKIRPKRTIRFILWAAEEQGLLGSLAYTEKHLASRPPAPASANGLARFFGWGNRFPITKKPGYNDMKAYFNMDNGSGKLRGIYAEGNAAAKPILSSWLSPFNSMGASRVVAGPTGSTDHVFMQQIGLPAYQFIQDPLDYFARLHHTNVDTLDHLRPADLRQASVVLAGILLQAANSEKTIPLRPLPTKPTATDPFKYDDPDDLVE